MSIDEAQSGEHGEGENYFVSMTDMMVGMLFIFIILLMSFALVFRTKADTQETVTEEQRRRIEAAERVADQLKRIRSDIDARIRELEEANQRRLRLLNEIRERLESQRIVVEISKDGDVLRLTENAVRFDPEKADLRADALLNIDKIAAALTQVLPRYAPCARGQRPPACAGPTETAVETVFVEGHTDETGSDERNWVLSAERAANTYRALVVKAPALLQISNRRSEQILSISGYSSTRRLDPSGTREAWAKNRRIDLRFVMERDPRAGLEEIRRLVTEMKSRVDELDGKRP